MKHLILLFLLSLTNFELQASDNQQLDTKHFTFRGQPQTIVEAVVPDEMVNRVDFTEILFDELIVVIAGFLSTRDLRALACACKALNRYSRQVFESRILTLTSSQITEELIDKTYRLKECELTVREVFWSNEMELIAGLTNLRKLDIDTTSVSAAALERITTLVALEYLNIGGARIVEGALRCLGNLTTITNLDLNHVPVTGRGLLPLRLLPLKTLNLQGTSITDGFEHLTIFTTLTNLDLSYTGTADPHLSMLIGLPLTTLSLKATKVTGVGLNLLTDLKRLDLTGTELTEAGLAELETITTLVRLNR